MTMSYKLDWINATLLDISHGMKECRDVRGAQHVLNIMRRGTSRTNLGKFDVRAEVIPPYRWGFKWVGFPGRFYIPLEVERMGVGYRATGQDLPEFSDGYLTHGTLKEMKARFTRLDFAFDFTDEGETMEALVILAREYLKDVQTAAFFVRHGRPSGFTVGSRQSDIFVRVYDKALEQGKDYRWIRAEVEVKGDRVAQFGETVTGGFQMSAEYLLRKILPPHTTIERELRDVFQDGLRPSPIVKNVASSRERWLWGDVQSSFIKLIHENPDGATDYAQGLMLQLALQLDKLGVRRLTDDDTGV